MILSITKSKTDAILEATRKLSFNNEDQIIQGTNVLATITDDVTLNDILGITLDSEGREAAVKMLQDINYGFKGIDKPDPSKIPDILDGVTSSVAAILEASLFVECILIHGLILIHNYRV